MSDCKDCFAVPGEGNIIDMIHPKTGLSFICGETLEQVRARYPGAERMTLADFCAAKYERQNSPVEWREVTEELYFEQLECLPPAYMNGGAFMVGEPADHCAKSGEPRFQGYYSKGGKYYAASRPMRRLEFVAALKEIFSPHRITAPLPA